MYQWNDVGIPEILPVFFCFVFSLSTQQQWWKFGTFVLCRYFTIFSWLLILCDQSNFQFFSINYWSCLLQTTDLPLMKHFSTFSVKSSFFAFFLLFKDIYFTPVYLLPTSLPTHLPTFLVCSLLHTQICVCIGIALHPTVMTSTSQGVLTRNTKEIQMFTRSSSILCTVYVSTSVPSLLTSFRSLVADSLVHSFPDTTYNRTSFYLMSTCKRNLEGKYLI